MSFTLSITGCKSALSTNYSPALQLGGEYECGLVFFSTFNSIPNVGKNNNKFYYGDNEMVEIPEGSYELLDIYDFLKSHLTDCTFKLMCNNNTLSTNIFCSKDIHFEKAGSIARTLGFRNEILKANILHDSVFPVSILSTTIVRIECDIVSGSYINGKPSHIIYEFAPSVPPGYRIIEIPKNLIYFPVNQDSVSEINIRILDTKNNLINLREEELQLYLHLRKK